MQSHGNSLFLCACMCWSHDFLFGWREERVGRVGEGGGVIEYGLLALVKKVYDQIR